MAQLKKIVRSSPMSNFSRTGPEAGAGFGVLAAGLETLNSRLEPAAMEMMKQKGQEAGLAAADGAVDLDITYPERPPQANIERNVAMAANGGPTRAAAAEMEGGDIGRMLNAKEAEKGLPPGYLTRTAQIESDFGRNMKNPNSSAEGPFQFIDSTARQYGLVNKRDWNESADAAARLGADNAAHLRRVLGREPTGAELYLAHQQGAGGAAKLLANPNAPASSIVGAEAVRLNGGGAGMTAGQFASKWMNKFDQGASKSMSAEFMAGGGSASAKAMGAALGMTPTVEIRTKSGNLESQLFSPYAGPILQAHNIAAKAAYQGSVLDKAALDMQEMRMAFEYDPDGFKSQATAYMDKLVEAAPEEMRGAIRGELEREVSRQVLGVTKDKQADIRQRAMNSNSAMIDRYEAEYVDAISSGNDEAAAMARARLSEVLRLRESLPGSGWTMENSAGALFNAERTAKKARDAAVATARREYESDIKDRLDLATDALKDGRVAEDEALLDDPAIAALEPKRVLRARAYRDLRDMTPEFNKLTPDAMDAVVAARRAEAVASEYDLIVTGGLEGLAEDAREEAVKEQKAKDEDLKDQVSVVVDALKEGRKPEGLDILTSEDAARVAPDLVQEGLSYVQRDEALKNDALMVPDVLDAAAARANEQAVSKEYQIEYGKELTRIARENRKAWEDDPVARAGEVLDTPPPPIQEAIASGDPQAVAAALTERRAYMNGLLEQGYFKQPTFFSKAESEALKAMFSTDIDPAVRVTMAGMLAGAMGEDAIRAFDEIDGDGPTMHAGKLIASGGSAVVATEIVVGSDMIRGGVANLPVGSIFKDVMEREIVSAIDRRLLTPEAQSSILKAGQAIYAARNGGADLESEEARVAVQDALSAAVGQGKNKAGEKTGGVQPVNGIPTLLPSGISAREAEDVLTRALRNAPRSGDALSRALSGPEAIGNWLLGVDAPGPNLDLFSEASDQGAPHFNGKPLDARTVSKAGMGIRALGGNDYALTVTVGPMTYDTTDAKGALYRFRLSDLIEGIE